MLHCKLQKETCTCHFTRCLDLHMILEFAFLRLRSVVLKPIHPPTSRFFSTPTSAAVQTPAPPTSTSFSKTSIFSYLFQYISPKPLPAINMAISLDSISESDLKRFALCWLNCDRSTVSPSRHSHMHLLTTTCRSTGTPPPNNGAPKFKSLPSRR